MAAVMVGQDSAVVQDSYYNNYDHGDFVFFFFEKADTDTTRLNKATRKLHNALNDGVVTYKLIHDRLLSWIRQTSIENNTYKCSSSMCLEDVLVGYLDHVLRIKIDEIAMIVHQFHSFRARTKSNKECLPESVWRKILIARKKTDSRGCMGLSKNFFFEE